MKIGIPRALLYYYYIPLWRTFFEALGLEVVISRPTTKTILESGLRHTGDDVCLPVRVAFGHIIDLKDRVDVLFLPRLVSIARREYVCPKFLGFPDMVRQGISGLPPLIEADLNLYRRDSLYPFFSALGRNFTSNRFAIYLACRRAQQVQARYVQLLEKGFFPEEALAILYRGASEEKREPARGWPRVAVIGHPYNIYDPYISMNLLSRLARSGVHVCAADNLPETLVREHAARLPKHLFWSLGQRMIGAAWHYLQRPDVDGIIHVASFACGPDSLTGELISREVKRRGKPFLNLTLDEHSAEAGVVTRLEAFLDMMRRRPLLQVGGNGR
ncbi:acyl-CoA dehydratase activase-related protein [Desulfofundulus thermocisternus]|uniref:acyl-CoA dehydratase activase-related protein n=1 Tax=Desulfofundulus thermocisternus TaxID=42471 RepID=UPI00217E931A|nr:acyl-CoA dehydratase activase-related protein [Desulfofundulus thermocisternus]MCS5696569.1 acyl-CoA dehydratase activase-related protein [Desulfofundulus thermocisternus]